MVYRIEVSFRPDIVDALGERTRTDIHNFLGIIVDQVRTRRVYTFDVELNLEELEKVKRELLVDPIIHDVSSDLPKFTWLIEVGYKPGVTDSVGKTAKKAIQDLLKRKFKDSEKVYTSIQYLVESAKISLKEIEKIGKELLFNEIIETLSILSYREVIEKGINIVPPIVSGKQHILVKEYDLSVSDRELIEISRKGVLALTLDEMKVIKNFFNDEGVREQRKRKGLGRNPTDVELETLAQTWSEHCKHKIFNALIHYKDGEKEEKIDSLFQTYIRKCTEEIMKDFPWLISIFVDNAGVIQLNDALNIVAKVETHNAPSAIEPYGGAMTGIVGVNRDPLGTGIGAKLMFNVFTYCFGSPYSKKINLTQVLHPRRVREGVHRGTIDGSNQSGIPLVIGRELFDKRFGEAKPLVYCGTFGIMPRELHGSPSHIKTIKPGDLIVMVGGKIGKDGIHGATFSSEELHKESPVQAVQIGDPITQKMMSDFLIEARDLGLYRSITDNGAGGLASSIGEMAMYSGGCEIELKPAPLKYQGLQPWEILLSEAQERMTLAVSPSKIKLLLELAQKRDVESTVLGTFTDSGKFHVKYDGKTVGYLDMKFLHEGVPKKKLRAIWENPRHDEPTFTEPNNLQQILEGMLARLNICSIEKKLRQYDHEVKGLSIIKPLIGKESDVPSDATVCLVEYGSTEGVIFANGINPHYSDVDTYHMTASAIDEAVRRVIAVGGKLPSDNIPFAALDNFCWPDPEQSEKTLDGHYKLAQLVRANKALYDYATAFRLPFISGKDSMKCDSVIDGKKISIPPSLLISVIAKMTDVRKAVTMDVKKSGDIVYIVGETFNELGGSEYYKLIGEKIEGREYVGNHVPRVAVEKAIAIYRCLSEATEKELIHSIHTPTKGGLGVAFAKIAFAGGYGLQVSLNKVPSSRVMRNDVILFSESNSRFIVTIPKDMKREFEFVMQDVPFAEVGVVIDEPRLKIRGLDDVFIINSDIHHLKKVWKYPLEEV
jgi:phosphoribosylformylglycinamidine synthase II